MMMTCDYYKSDRDTVNDWVTVSMDAECAALYLRPVYKSAVEITKDLLDAKDLEHAAISFDFATAVLNTIHRIEAEKEGE